MNIIGYFEIQSSDPEREIQFYEALFGWKFTREYHVPIPYYRIETGTIPGGLMARPAPLPPAECGANAFVNSVYVENFDICSSMILRHGGRIAVPKFAIPGRCWQGYFMDQDNNLFGIYEADEQAGL